MALQLAAVAVIATLAAGGLLVIGRQGPGPGSPAASSSSQDTGSSILRYEDGIPAKWQGQPVLRWVDAVTKARGMTDDTPFFLGVWMYTYPPGTVVHCPKGSEPDPSWPQSWIDYSHCPFVFIRPQKGSDSIDGSNAVTFHFMAGVDQLRTGPAILRVHVHDPRASLCGNQKAVCDSMLVVESAVWTGDSATAPRPLTLADVQAAVATVDQHPDRIIPPNGDLLSDDVLGLSGARDEYSFPNSGPFAMQLMGVSVMDSPSDAKKALPHSATGANGVLQLSADWSLETYPDVSGDTSFSVRWLIVENVAIRLRLMPNPSTADDAFARQLEAALRARL